MPPIDILVIGGGAIGSFFASRLAQASGTQVSIVCRSNYQVVKKSGFSIDSWQFGSYKFIPFHTFADPQEASRKGEGGKGYDYILVCTKSLPDHEDESAMIQDLVGKETTIGLLQNGVGIEEPYAKRFPKSPILSAITRSSCAQPTHGVIYHKNWNDIRIGPYVSEHVMVHEAMSKANDLVGLFKAGGIEDAVAFDSTKMQLSRWHKVAINAAMNASGVLSGGTTNKAMALDTEFYTHLKSVMQEIWDIVPSILGEPFPAEFPTPEAILKGVQKDTSGSRPSMWADWQSQDRPMELEVILGNPIRIAREHGLEMPRVQTMYALLKKAQENRDASAKL